VVYNFRVQNPLHWISVLCVSFAIHADVASAAPRDSQPNIILLFADDLGYTGLGCYGSDLHETPNLDRLAQNGMRFTSAYSACTVCSPTRASLMTGKYPARLRLTDFIAGQNRPYAKLRIPDWNKRLELTEVTLPERLKAVGYQTAHVGKWHLSPRGADARQFGPEQQGFDISIEKPAESKGYFIPQRVIESRKLSSGYVTDYLTDHAVRIIDQWKDRPFFLYFAYHTPHTPIQGKPELVEHYRNKIRPGLRHNDLRHNNATYAAMVHSLDESVGRVRRAIEQAGLEKQTIILFISDNGGLSHKFGEPTGFIDNHPLRRGKGSAYEGGTRVPMIVKWPGVTRPGSSSDEPVCTVDFLPTILDIAGQPPQAGLDGQSLVPILRSPQADLQRDALYWHYPHYHAGGDSPYGAVRAGRWKLIEFYEEMRVELYDLESDLGESVNLAEQNSAKRDQLRELLHRWRDSVGAQMPTDNPDFDAELARRMASGKKIVQAELPKNK
jgi:arylsulfatase A-like enzyme